MRLPRVFVSTIDHSTRRVLLPADESHHLVRSVRLEAGAAVVLFDGRGSEWLARIESVGRRGAIVEILEVATPVAEPPIRVTLGIGLLKGDQMDAVVRDATMLGVAAIVPLATDHVSVSKSNLLRARHSDVLARWRRVAIASAKQCARSVLPLVVPVTPFEEMVTRPEFEVKLMCVEPSAAGAGRRRGHEMGRAGEPVPASVLLLCGPEGGWSAGEIELAGRHHTRFVHLGPRTLRADAAPIVALTALWTAWGWEDTSGTSGTSGTEE